MMPGWRLAELGTGMLLLTLVAAYGKIPAVIDVGAFTGLTMLVVGLGWAAVQVISEEWHDWRQNARERGRDE